MECGIYSGFRTCRKISDISVCADKFIISYGFKEVSSVHLIFPIVRQRQ